MVLTGKQIIENGIVSDLIDPSLQEQSCGVDLSVAKIEMFMSSGVIDFDNSQRAKPRLAEVTMLDGGADLRPGSYLITMNETVKVPIDMMGLARPRSTMLRCGATMETSVWDPGYEGKSQCMMVVYNQHGLRICKNARVMQIVFLPIGQDAKAYNGVYQREGLSA